jgi:hypothetical protein
MPTDMHPGETWGEATKRRFREEAAKLYECRSCHPRSRERGTNTVSIIPPQRRFVGRLTGFWKSKWLWSRLVKIEMPIEQVPRYRLDTWTPEWVNCKTGKGSCDAE